MMAAAAIGIVLGIWIGIWSARSLWPAGGASEQLEQREDNRASNRKAAETSNTTEQERERETDARTRERESNSNTRRGYIYLSD